jgi:uncharacterized membrane protein SpoIIM required for sporulation
MGFMNILVICLMITSLDDDFLHSFTPNFIRVLLDLPKQEPKQKTKTSIFLNFAKFIVLVGTMAYALYLIFFDVI